MEATELGMITFDRAVHCVKAKSWMEITEFGILKLVKAHPEKACLPMIVTELGIVTLAKCTQPLKAKSSMPVAVSGMLTA